MDIVITPITETLDSFIKEHKLDEKQGKHLVYHGQLDRLREQNCSVEMLLDRLSENYGSLFYGTGKNIDADKNSYLLKPNEKNIVASTNLGAVALINALIIKDRNPHPKIIIPCKIDSEHPFKVEIYCLPHPYLHTEGFVYIINNTEGFENNPNCSWQFLKKTNDAIESTVKIPVTKRDFKYPIHDVSHNRVF